MKFLGVNCLAVLLAVLVCGFAVEASIYSDQHYIASRAFVSKSAITDKDFCANSIKWLKEPLDDLEDLYHVVIALSHAGCKFKLSAEKLKQVKNGFSSEFLVHAYYSSKVALALVQDKQAAYADFDFSSAVVKVLEKLEDDSTVPATAAIQLGYSYELIGNFLSAPEIKLTADHSSKLKSFVARAEEVLLFTSDSDEGIFLPSKTRSGVSANNIVLTGLAAVSSLGGFTIPKNVIISWKAYFTTVQHAYLNGEANLEDSYSIASALTLLSRFSLGIPVVITSEKQDFTSPLSANSDFSITVTDTLQASIPTTAGMTASATITKVGDSNPVVSGAAMKSTSTGFVLSLNTALKATSAAGIYSVRVSVNFGESSKYLNDVSEFSFKLSTLAPKGKTASLSVSESHTAEGKNKQTAEFPSAVTETLVADGSQHLHISFSLNGAKPHQTFVQLSYNGDTSGILDATLISNTFLPVLKDGVYTVNIELGASQNVLKLTKVGRYSISILIGDSVYSKSVRWTIGSIDLNLADVLAALRPDATTSTIRKPAPPIAPIYETLKPEITHIFRGADPRPGKLVALLFTGLTSAPFILLCFWLVTYSGASFEVFGTGFLFKFGFLGCILGMLLVMCSYWIALPTVTTFMYLSALGFLGLFFGSKAMSNK